MFNDLEFVRADEIEATKIICYYYYNYLRNNQQEMVNTSMFNDLENSLFLRQNDKGIYCCTGRLSQEILLPYNIKGAVLLTFNHRLTRLIVIDAHNRVKKDGERHTLAEVRNEYWILKGKRFVLKIVQRCIMCRKFNVRLYNFPLQLFA